MTSARDPTLMSPAERLSELAAILAAGYIRSLTKGRISLKEPSAVAESMALCDQVVNRIEMPPGKETA